MKRTIFDLIVRAENAINRHEEIVLETAVNNGQSFRNVSHAKWFKLEVMKELCYNFKCWEHLTEHVEKMNFFDL